MLGKSIGNKISCIVLIYYDFEVIQKSINCLLKYSDKLDLTIVENKSEFTEISIKPFILDLVNQMKVSQYFLFDINISNNAIEVACDSGLVKFENYCYVLLTDGDLEEITKSWLEEEINILSNNADIFACGISLNKENLPTKTFPGAVDWIPPDIKEDKDFYEALTGMHLLLLRSSDFIDYLGYRKRNHLKFRDSTMHKFCYEIKNKKWARTKINQARHLTWDSYNNLGHPYTKNKISKKFEETWDHELYSPYKVYTKYNFQCLNHQK